MAEDNPALARTFLADLAQLLLSGSGEGTASVREELVHAGARFGLEVDLLLLPDQLLLTFGDGASGASRVINYPAWLRVLGVALFAIGFAPSVVPSGQEIAATAALGRVMGFVVRRLLGPTMGALAAP